MSYMQRLADHIDCPLTGLTMCFVLLDLAVFIIPKDQHTDELFKSILDARRVAFEWDEDLETVLELEYILDCFDKDDRKDVEKEVAKAKCTRSDAKQFNTDVCEWKVLSRNGFINGVIL